MFDNGPILAWGLFYLDPGSGSFILQLLLGAGMGLIVAAKLYWSKLKGLMTRKKSDAGQSTNAFDDEDR